MKKNATLAFEPPRELSDQQVPGFLEDAPRRGAGGVGRWPAPAPGEAEAERRSARRAIGRAPKKTGSGGRPRSLLRLLCPSYFLSISMAAFALSAAMSVLPALHAASASLTSVVAFFNSAERAAVIEARGAWTS